MGRFLRQKSHNGLFCIFLIHEANSEKSQNTLEKIKLLDVNILFYLPTQDDVFSLGQCLQIYGYLISAGTEKERWPLISVA